MRHLIVPTDFSEAAHNASAYAEHLAIEFGARITLVHIHAIPMDPMRLGDFGGELLEDSEATMKRHATRMRDVGLEVDTQVLLGNAVGRLKAIVQKSEADLVVMGCQGEHYLPGKFFGSTTTALMDEVRVPILAVPANSPPDFPENIVWAVDASPPPEVATLAPLLELLGRAGTELKVFHYREKRGGSLPQAKFAEVLSGYDHDFFVQLANGESPEEAIVEFIELTQADLVAVTHRRSNWFSKLLTVSTTRRTVWSSPVPVLILQDSKSVR